MKTYLCILILTICVTSVGARPPIYSEYEKIQKSDLIILAEVVKFSRDSGIVVRVDRVFKGRAPLGLLEIPFEDSYLGSVESPAISLKDGDIAYLFFVRNNSEYELLANSQGVYFDNENDGYVFGIIIEELIAYSETLQPSILENMISREGVSRLAALGAIRAHASMLKNDKNIAGAILTCFNDGDPRVRRDAVWLTNLLGISESSILQHLYQNDSDESVRVAAKAVLEKSHNATNTRKED